MAKKKKIKEDNITVTAIVAPELSLTQTAHILTFLFGFYVLLNFETISLIVHETIYANCSLLVNL